MIQSLSQAIIIRCEQKAKAYEASSLTKVQWLTALQQMESVLTTHYFATEQFAAYSKIAEQGLLLQRLYEEQRNASLLTKRLTEPQDAVAIIAEQIATLEESLRQEVTQAPFLQPTVKELIFQMGMKKSEA